MSLLGGWEERLKAVPPVVSSEVLAWHLDPLRASAQVRVIESVDDGRRFLRDLQATPLSAIALTVHHAAQDAFRWC